ncbi:hypothetical protein GRC92_14310, partial [Streptococcus thermophilus]|nr:hypothetical protein [Streptococcus thermophilus]
QILEFCGNELLLESAFVKTIHTHRATVKVSEFDDVDHTLNNALNEHQLIAIRSADGSDMFFVGFINALNADSVLLNLIDMTGQFGGYTLCR